MRLGTKPFQGAKLLGNLLRACPAIEALRLQNCGVCSPEEIATALLEPGTAPGLLEIALGANSISEDSGLRAVAAARVARGLKLHMEGQVSK